MLNHRISLWGILAVVTCFAACGESGTTADSKAVADTIQIVKDSVATPAAPAAFTQSVTYDNRISFSVYAPQLAAGNSIIIVPSGFTASNDSIRMDVEGTVVKVETADISGDNSPELLVVTKDAAGKGHAYVFSGNKDKSVSQVNMADAGSTKGALDGYQGEDEFALVESVLARRFPVFAEGTKTGKTRQIQFKLNNGEAMKQLKVDKVTEF